MGVTRCPRCARESATAAPFCGGCGAPLRLVDEALPPPLDLALELDRRIDEREEPDATAGTPAFASQPRTPRPRDASSRRRELAPPERSSWDLGRGPPPAGETFTLQPEAATRDDALPEPEVETLEVHVERPAAWRRAAAWSIDGIPFVLAGGALARSLIREAGAALPAPPDGIDGFLDLLARERLIALSVVAAAALAFAVYATLAHTLAGATLGKRLLGLRVIGPDGAPPSPARSAARSALAALSAGLLGLGLLLALFTRSGRALHDLLARTWVVKAP
jgi:uncharacterized RDD family membrane protein YckC